MADLFFAILSVTGILGMTFLFPLLAAATCKITHRRSQPDDLPRRIAILVPAHNEAPMLAKSLRSIKRSLLFARKMLAARRGWKCEFRIIVGADGCSDETAKTALKLNAEVVENSQRRGKWMTILNLLKSCEGSDWVILADCGVEWPLTIFSDLLPELRKSNVMAVAPAYRNRNAGALEKISWQLECSLKALESVSGGPVSVHGATVCYRYRELIESLEFLASKSWLNDDVVIPIAMHARCPEMKIIYLNKLVVSDALKPLALPLPEFKRRRRMVIGNIEWIKQLWLPLWKRDYVAAILAARRIFRMLWVYWAAFAMLAAALYLGLHVTADPYTVSALVILLALAFRYSRKILNLAQCACASALAPFYFVSFTFNNPNTRLPQWN